MSSAWIESDKKTEIDKNFEDNFVASEEESSNKREFTKLDDSADYLAHLGN
jgi:hypothetical protein